ncbi:hypothetical protein EYF80_068042 [Liparis tanakae]
MRRRD